MKLPNTSNPSNPIGHRMSNVWQNKRGFTLIEVIVVMAIVGMLFMFGTIFGFDSLTRSTVIDERDLLVTNLLATRARALANMRELPQGLRIQVDSLVLFEGAVYSASSPANRTISRNAAITISPALPFDIVFSQLSGNSIVGAGTLTLTDGAQTQTIMLNNAGRIDW